MSWWDNVREGAGMRVFTQWVCVCVVREMLGVWYGEAGVWQV